jgi:acetyltransferase-like isoleucine patch superfamily enzyme
MIHKTADVQSDKIGIGTYVWQYSIILKEAKIGQNCNINCHCFIENEVVIGNNVTVKSGVYIWDGITIEDDVFIGPNVTFVNDIYPRSKQYPEKFASSIIKEGASIGANSTILANVIVGKFALIGAGSVITKNVPDFTLWLGNPAKQVGFVTKEGVTLNLDLIDKKTGEQYAFNTANEPTKK